MNLALDIGNSFTKAGFFEKETTITVEKVVSGPQLKDLCAQYHPANIIISNVGHQEEPYSSIAFDFCPVLLFSHTTPVPIINLYATPETLGLDRLAAVVGASNLYPGSNILVIDAGTAITFDLIDHKKQYHGGAISPGMNMRLQALSAYTSRLPVVSITGPPGLIGKSTKKSIASGVFWGIAGEMEGQIERYRKDYDALVVVICGGDSAFFESTLKEPIFARPNLVLEGLNTVLNYNVHS